MKDLNLTVIVPKLPPSINGLGDYGLSLARQMRIEFGIVTNFIVGDPSWQGPDVVEGFQVSKLKARSKKELSLLLAKSHRVLLHYVGYGYARRGCPVWLVQSLKEWKMSHDNAKCMTMFHECYAFGPIWTSQFWTSPLQKKLVSDLAFLSDECATSKNAYAEIIQKLNKGKHKMITVIPVFSNLGELSKFVPISEREKTLVVFGSAQWRTRVYKNSDEDLRKVINVLEIKKVIDIGASLNFTVNFGREVEFVTLGNLEAKEISKIFSSSLVGFFSYPVAHLAKSGIFASYCAHGLLPIGGWNEVQKSDGVEVGVHFLLASDINQNVGLLEIEKIVSNAFNWYHSHNLSVHAKKFADILWRI